MHLNRESEKKIGVSLSIVLVLALVLYFSSLKQGIFFQPGENTVYSFLSDLESNPENYEIVIGNSISSQELSIINGFAGNFSVNKILLSESSSNENKVFIGLNSSFLNLPYQNKIISQQAIVLFNFTTNSIYIYAYDLDSLSAITLILSDFNSYSDSLNNFAIELVGGYLEELFLDPVIRSRRTISPVSLNQEAEVSLDIEVFRQIDSLLVAELLSTGFNVLDKSPGYIINSSNLVVWYAADLDVGNYSFNYTFIPTVNSGQILGKSGVKIGVSEEDYQILGQSSITINSGTIVDPGTPSGGGGGGGGGGEGFTPLANPNFISFQELTSGKSLSKGKLESVIVEFNLGENHTLTIEDIQKNYVSLILQSSPIKINLVLGQSTRISLTNSNLYELYLVLDKIEYGKAYFSIKRINEQIDRNNFDSEMPASFNSSLLNFDRNILTKILIFSAIILVIIILSLVLFKKKRSILGNFIKKEGISDFHLEKARAIVFEYKNRGYSNESIKQIFRIKGWKEGDIDRLFG